MAEAGFTVSTPPVTIQLNIMRIVARCCLTDDFNNPSFKSFSMYTASAMGSIMSSARWASSKPIMDYHYMYENKTALPHA